jgi:sugar/nucleoside kinase (ribokinase family)
MSKENTSLGGRGLDVVGIGNAIVDVLAKAEEAFLQSARINKGTMTLIEAAQAETLYAKMSNTMEMSGGSAANTMAALASLGSTAGYIGKVAHDTLGAAFRTDIMRAGVHFDTASLEGDVPTARCLIWVTPDAQRTMCTYLGACVWISPEDIDAAMIASAKVTYLEGYLFDRARAKQAFLKAADIAHAAGKKVSLTLSDPFCVDRHREEFLGLVKDHVDILFANEAEIMSLYKADHFDDAMQQVRGHCEVVALTRSERGSVIISGDQTIHITAEPVAQVMDTTGAGDLYAAGFLHGYCQGKPLAVCGKMASVAAAEILVQMGARSQKNLADILKEKLVA